MLKLTATSYQRRLGLYGLMQWQVMPLTHSIQIARSAVPSMSCLALTLIRFTLLILFRSRCRRVGVRSHIVTIPSYAWRLGTGRRMGRGAMQHTSADISRAAPNLRNPSATSLLMHYRTEVLRPAAIGQCKGLTSHVGKAIRI